MSYYARSTREVQSAMETQYELVNTIMSDLDAQDAKILSMIPEIHRLSAPTASAPELLSFIKTHLSTAEQHRNAIACKLALQRYVTQGMEKEMQGEAYLALLRDERLAAEETALIAHTLKNLPPLVHTGNDQPTVEAFLKGNLSSETVNWHWCNERMVEVGSRCLINSYQGGRQPTHQQAYQAFALAKATKSNGSPVYVVCYAVRQDDNATDALEYRVVPIHTVIHHEQQKEGV